MPTPAELRTIEVSRNLLGKNDQLAEKNRARFRARRLAVLNVLSSPGSGKTALLARTLDDLVARFQIGAIVGDLATDNDARRLRRPGVNVVQITTGNLCHLEAGMVSRACDDVEIGALDLLFIENVGNLVCPAGYDLGESARVVLMSVTEGEDKPLKYPKMFKTAHLVVVSKTDLSGPAGFDRDAALSNLGRVAPQARIMELSVRTGTGLREWYRYLDEMVVHARHES